MICSVYYSNINQVNSIETINNYKKSKASSERNSYKSQKPNKKRLYWNIKLVQSEYYTFLPINLCHWVHNTHHQHHGNRRTPESESYDCNFHANTPRLWQHWMYIREEHTLHAHKDEQLTFTTKMQFFNVQGLQKRSLSGVPVILLCSKSIGQQ